MTSKIKVDNINKVSDDSNIIKKCGTTTTIGSGASNPIVVDGSAVTLGRCGGTVALASGATQTGFGRTGTVDWQTGSIKTATFTAANGEGYFANTSGSAFNMNLPAGTAGNIVSVVDYTNTFQTNSLTVSPNGSQKIGGIAASVTLSTEGQSVTFVYVDDTEGWKNVQDSTSNVIGNSFIIATGGTITTSGNCKIHTFTGPGTFTVVSAAVCSSNNKAGYLVVAGGGGGGRIRGGGGGAGGFREGRCGPVTPYTDSPLGTTGITVSAQAYPITVGGGGLGASNAPVVSTQGSTSSALSISSAGGGRGGQQDNDVGGNGGSGGGAEGRFATSGGTGNTPPVSPPQGTNGGSANGSGSPNDRFAGTGGGGATAAGSGNPNSCQAGAGGAGATTSISASSTTYSGGGGGGAGSTATTAGTGGAGGSGGGGDGKGGTQSPADGDAGTVNTGGGGGAGNTNNSAPAYGGTGGAGGSGIVIIRYKFQ